MKYLADNDGQPAIAFLKCCRIFDPARVALLLHNKNNYHHIPNFVKIFSVHEWELYLNVLDCDAATAQGLEGGSVKVHIDAFWNRVHDRVPNLASLASKYKDCITNLADAEKNNSLYNIVLSDRRHSLSQQKLRELVCLYFNTHS